MAVTLYEPSVAFFWGNRISSPTARSPTVIVAPPLVIVVVESTVIVRVQPSSVLSERDDPSIAVIVMSRNPPGAERAVPPGSARQGERRPATGTPRARAPWCGARARRRGSRSRPERSLAAGATLALGSAPVVDGATRPSRRRRRRRPGRWRRRPSPRDRRSSARSAPGRARGIRSRSVRSSGPPALCGPLTYGSTRSRHDLVATPCAAILRSF